MNFSNSTHSVRIFMWEIQNGPFLIFFLNGSARFSSEKKHLISLFCPQRIHEWSGDECLGASFIGIPMCSTIVIYLQCYQCAQ